MFKQYHLTNTFQIINLSILKSLNCTKSGYQHHKHFINALMAHATVMIKKSLNIIISGKKIKPFILLPYIIFQGGMTLSC